MGTVIGPLSEPAANLEVTSNEISWQQLRVGNVAARVQLDSNGLDVGDSHAEIADGQVNATGSLAWQDRRAHIDAWWRAVDAARLVSAISSASVTPAGRASGEIKASGSIDSIDGWDVEARVALEGGQLGRGRVPAQVRLGSIFAAGQWGIEARHLVGGVTAVDVSLMGRLRGARIVDSALMGTLRASESDIQAILQMLSESGLASVQQDLVTRSESVRTWTGPSRRRSCTWLSRVTRPRYLDSSL